MATPRLTNEQYHDLDGSICPFCGTRNITIIGKSVMNHDLRCVTQTVTCNDCSENWYDVDNRRGFIPIEASTAA